jgi:hypothetical protein
MLCIEDWVAPLNLAELSLHADLRDRSSMLCIENWWPPKPKILIILYAAERHANLALLSLAGVIDMLSLYNLPLYKGDP